MSNILLKFLSVAFAVLILAACEKGTVGSAVAVNSGSLETVSVNSGSPEKRAAAMPKGFVKQGGLTWMPISFNKNWSEANAYCSNTAINGQNGWRLPTKDELSALYNSGAMKDQGWRLDNTWSSTPDVSGRHYYGGLSVGGVYSGGDTSLDYVTCVR